MHIKNKVFLIIFIILLNNLLNALDFKATASSMLEENIGGNDVVYGPSNLNDNDLSTAWVEGVDGYGNGEWIEYNFSVSTYIGKLLIANGYQKRRDLYYKNNRVLEISVIINEKDERTYFLYDSNMWNVCVIDSNVKTLRIIIKDFYHGALYDDACISEIKFDQTFITDNYVTLYEKELSTIPEIERKEKDFLSYFYGRTSHEQIEEFGKEYENLTAELRDDNIVFTNEQRLYRGSLKSFLKNSNSKEAWISNFKVYPEATVLSADLFTKRYLLFEIADEIELNRIMQEIPTYQFNLDGQFLINEPVFSELDNIIYKRITGNNVYQIGQEVWILSDFYLYNKARHYPYLQNENKIYLNANEDLQRWETQQYALYIESFEIIENTIENGKLNINIDNLLEMNIDVSTLRTGDVIYLGLFTSDFSLDIDSVKDSGTLIIKPTYGYNWHDGHEFDNFLPFMNQK